MDVIREFVLVEYQKSWTIWSLVNVPLHSQRIKKNVLKENVLVKADTSLQPVGQLGNTPLDLPWPGLGLSYHQTRMVSTN